MLGQGRCGFNKKHARTRYAEHAFLHPAGFAGHVVHSGAFGCETSMQYFSCSGWTDTDSTKSTPGYVMPNLCFGSSGICGSRNAFWCTRAIRLRCTIFSCSGGLGTDSLKSLSGHVTPTYVFASSEISG
jgi:hypothetical protein